MDDFLVIGALALGRPIQLNGPLESGARLLGRTLDGALAPRLGGGAANAAVALARSGHRVAVCGSVARDHDGDACLAMARKAGLDITRVVRRAGTSRTTLILIEPGGERVVLGLDPDHLTLPPLPAPQPGETFAGLYVRAPFPGAEAWAAACRGTVLAHWPTGAFAGPCDILVASVDDCDPATLADPFAAGRAQVGERLKWMVLTSGSRGVTAHDGRRSVVVRPPPARAVDTTGAGDCFAAGLLEALTAGAEMEPALAQACAWGALAVGLEASAPLDGVFRAFRPAEP